MQEVRTGESGDHLVFSTAPPENLRPLENFKGEEGRRFWKTFEDVGMGDWTRKEVIEVWKTVEVDQAFAFFSEVVV